MTDLVAGLVSNACTDCGEPLDDYAECSCRLSADRPARKPSSWSMRDMVRRKIANKRAAKP